MKLIKTSVFLGAFFLAFNCSADLQESDEILATQACIENSGPLTKSELLKKQIGECLSLPISNDETKNKCGFALLKIGALHKADVLNQFLEEEITERPFIKKGVITIDRRDCFSMTLDNAFINNLTVRKFNENNPGYSLKLKSIGLTEIDATYKYSIESDNIITPIIDQSWRLLIYLGLQKIKNEKI